MQEKKDKTDIYSAAEYIVRSAAVASEGRKSILVLLMKPYNGAVTGISDKKNSAPINQLKKCFCTEHSYRCGISCIRIRERYWNHMQRR